MSAICAVVGRGGRAVDAAALDKFFDPSAAPRTLPRSAHRRILCSRLSKWLGHAPARGREPNRGGHNCVSQRIDNRAELIPLLVSRWPDVAADDDAGLVLRAFVQWEEGCAARLLGDFAFVVCDSSRRVVYAARDAIGVKPFYYFLNDQELVAATELSQILAADVPLAPCEPMVAELLAFDVRSRHETLYRDIYRLPPGHWLRVTDGQVQVTIVPETRSDQRAAISA